MTAERDPGFVVQGRTGGYFVKSRTEPGVWWMVDGDDCSCHAGRAGHGRCWHRQQVAAFVARVNESNRRPSPPANVTALVD